MGVLIEWLKGDAAPNDYVEVSETNPLPIKAPNDLIHAGSKQGKVNLSTTPAILKIGATSLSGRHTLTVYNDASAIVYVGFNSNVSSNDGFQLSSGIGITFKFDSDELVEVYGVLDEGTTSISLIELK